MKVIKNKLVEYLKDKLYDLEGITRIERFITDHYVIASKSFRDYATGQSISNGRRFRMSLNMMLMIFNIARYIVLSFNDDKWILILMGEFSYKLYDMKIMAKFILIGICIGLSYQSVTYWVEYKHRFKMIEVLYQMQQNDRRYRLTKFNTRKFNIFSYVMYKILIVLGCGLYGLCIGIAFVLMYLAYMDNQIDHVPLLLILNMLNLSFLIEYIFITIYTPTALFYLTIYYARLKYIEFLAFFRNNMKLFLYNHHEIYKIILMHKQLRELIIDLSAHINMVIGCVYNLYPYMIVLSLHIALESENTRIIIFMTLVCFTSLMFSYIINMVSSWFPHKNLDIPKTLYPLFFINRFNDKRLLLKLDEFILSLNENFVGFHCFNLFAFTKMSFYQYIFGLSITYILVSENIKK